MKKAVENQFRILRILAFPLTAPWSRGDTRIFIALMGLALWVGIEFWWLAPPIVALVILVSGILYAKRSTEEWEQDMIETLRQELVWNITNRNVLAEKYHAYYVGLPGDENNVEDWREYAPGETWESVTRSTEGEQ